MNPSPGNFPRELQNLFRFHDEATTTFRAELAQRTAGQILYDDYLLAQMRKGKPFKVALRKANAEFPTEALEPSTVDLAAVEEHYQYFLGIMDLDEQRRQIVDGQLKIEENERRIADLLASRPTEAGQPGAAGAEARNGVAGL